MSSPIIALIATTIAVAVAIGIVIYRVRSRRAATRPESVALRRGQSLPDFSVVDEHRQTVHSNELRGTATVMLFVRGNWCPFCSSQVENLVVHYKAIDALGARLILVTPKPLETTRRVADFFEVEFDFWLDEDLAVSRQLGLLHASGVPDNYRREYGDDTLWPMALVIDTDGIIRFAEKSKQLSDRPDPEVLLQQLRAALTD